MYEVKYDCKILWLWKCKKLPKKKKKRKKLLKKISKKNTRTHTRTHTLEEYMHKFNFFYLPDRSPRLVLCIGVLVCQNTQSTPARLYFYCFIGNHFATDRRSNESKGLHLMIANSLYISLLNVSHLFLKAEKAEIIRQKHKRKESHEKGNMNSLPN